MVRTRYVVRICHSPASFRAEEIYKKESREKDSKEGKASEGRKALARQAGIIKKVPLGISEPYIQEGEAQAKET